MFKVFVPRNQFENITNICSTVQKKILFKKLGSKNIHSVLKTEHSIKHNLLIFGIGLNEKPFNKRNWQTLSSFSFGILLSGAYFFCEAKTFNEYAQSVFTTTLFINFTLMFALFVWNMRQFLAQLKQNKLLMAVSRFYHKLQTISLYTL